MPNPARFCGHCGTLLQQDKPVDGALRAPCAMCGRFTAVAAHGLGPSILVQVSVFAEDKMLLLRRGLPPYVDRWAPVGGFVEGGESLETAAIREAREEVGIALASEQLVPHGVISLPALDQVHVLFFVVLERTVALSPSLPEALDAAWFRESEFPLSEIWEPHRNFDAALLFDRARKSRLELYQQSESWLRVITEDCRFTYLWRNADG